MRKSHCCGATIRRFAERRRQCCKCLRTWRIRTKKRGRPKHRNGERLVCRVLLKRRSLTELAREKGLTRQAMSYRFLRALERRSTEPAVIATGDAILLVDGLWFRFRRRPWVLYLMATRPINGDTAIFLEPLMLPGPESKTAWLRALETIPLAHRARIRALVCDNFVGSRSIAQANNWVLQLCHFHLIAQLRRRLGYGNLKTPARLMRQHAYRLIRTALDTPNEAQVDSITFTLKQLVREAIGARRYANLVRQFLRRLSDYRAYQRHPHLRLPKPTGSAESLRRVLRDLTRRTRGISSPTALQLWMKHYIELRPQISCKAADLSTN